MELTHKELGDTSIDVVANQPVCWCGTAITRQERNDLPRKNGNTLCYLSCIASYQEKYHVKR